MVEKDTFDKFNSSLYHILHRSQPLLYLILVEGRTVRQYPNNG